MRRINEEGGIIVVIGHQTGEAEIVGPDWIITLQSMRSTTEVCKPNIASRRVGVGSQILKAMGVKQMRLLSSPKRYALSGFGLEVTEYISE